MPGIQLNGFPLGRPISSAPNWWPEDGNSIHRPARLGLAEICPLAPRIGASSPNWPCDWADYVAGGQLPSFVLASGSHRTVVVPTPQGDRSYCVLTIPVVRGSLLEESAGKSLRPTCCFFPFSSYFCIQLPLLLHLSTFPTPVPVQGHCSPTDVEHPVHHVYRIRLNNSVLVARSIHSLVIHYATKPPTSLGQGPFQCSPKIRDVYSSGRVGHCPQAREEARQVQQLVAYVSSFSLSDVLNSDELPTVGAGLNMFE